MTEYRIDLNADLGEADSVDALVADRAIMPVISSCSIACGGHIGNAATMRTTLQLAAHHDVTAGAHPSYPDRANFGRVSMDMAAPELRDSLVAQIGALMNIAGELGIRLRHIKPHGALYNDAAGNPVLAQQLIRIFSEAFPDLAIVGLAGGAMEQAAATAGKDYIPEAFADRRYTDNSHLQPRSEPGAVITDWQEQAEQALAIALRHRVASNSGRPVAVRAQTLCLHGDTPGAAENAAKVRQALEAKGVTIESNALRSPAL
ncbi:MAG: 5-oxoprolinase subunit PxpA [Pseudomonadota bacterium]